MTPQITKSARIDIAKMTKKGWAYQRKTLSKHYVFTNFDDAFGFMARMALDIAKHDHHPAWFNVYNKVYVEWTTHDAGGVTAKDLELASLTDKIAARFLTKR